MAIGKVTKSAHQYSTKPEQQVITDCRPSTERVGLSEDIEITVSSFLTANAGAVAIFCAVFESRRQQSHLRVAWLNEWAVV